MLICSAAILCELNFKTFFSDHVNHYLEQASWRKELKGKEQHDSYLLHELASYGLQALHELVSLVHDHVNGSDKNQPVLSNEEIV